MEYEIAIFLSTESAAKLARLLRSVNTDTFDHLATSLGSHLGICSSTDEQDELDEGLSEGETFSWSIYDADDISDHSDCTEETFTYVDADT